MKDNFFQLLKYYPIYKTGSTKSACPPKSISGLDSSISITKVSAEVSDVVPATDATRARCLMANSRCGNQTRLGKTTVTKEGQKDKRKKEERKK